MGGLALETRRWGRSDASESRRAQRRRVVRALRAQGRYGPELREVLPALAGLTATVCALVTVLAAAHRFLGVGGLAGGLVLLAVVVGAGLHRGRPPVRRRLGYYTPAEIAELDTAGLMLAVARMLRRDGWHLPPLPEEDRPRLCARDARGRRLDVAFRPVAEPLPDEDTPMPVSGRAKSGPHLRLVVHRGAFQQRDVQWARRRSGTRLIDGTLLRRWGDGTPLHELIEPTEPAPGPESH